MNNIYSLNISDNSKTSREVVMLRYDYYYFNTFLSLTAIIASGTHRTENCQLSLECNVMSIIGTS